MIVLADWYCGESRPQVSRMLLRLPRIKSRTEEIRLSVEESCELCWVGVSEFDAGGRLSDMFFFDGEKLGPSTGAALNESGSRREK